MWSRMPEKENQSLLTVYNKDKTIYGFIDEKDESYSTIRKTITENGVFGDKGFFVTYFCGSFVFYLYMQRQ